MERTYYSNGKLLLTGEYLVLHGAESLVVPLRMGQSMQVREAGKGSGDQIFWTAKQYDRQWFHAVLHGKDFSVTETNNMVVCNKLIRLLQEIRRLNPHKFGTSLNFETNVSFDMAWGFGSSSSLISNLASWSDIDPFLLHSGVSDGSGYDIAAAGMDGPFIYTVKNRQRSVDEVNFQPAFADHFYFVHLGNKQSSADETNRYMKLGKPGIELIRKISEITSAMVRSKYLEDFMILMDEHEQFLAKHIRKKTIRETLFASFAGSVKSLGAWGGDFVLMVSGKGNGYVRDYLAETGFPVYFRYRDLVLSNDKVFHTETL